MGRNISLIPQRRICFPCKTKNCFLMVCSQVVLWSSASVTVFFWKLSKDDKLLLLLHSTNQMGWTKWFLCLLFWLEKHSFAAPSASLFLPVSCSLRVILKKGEHDRNVWLKQEKRWVWSRLEIYSIKEEIGGSVYLGHTLLTVSGSWVPPLPAVCNTCECPPAWCGCYSPSAGKVVVCCCSEHSLSLFRSLLVEVLFQGHVHKGHVMAWVFLWQT